MSLDVNATFNHSGKGLDLGRIGQTFGLHVLGHRCWSDSLLVCWSMNTISGGFQRQLSPNSLHGYNTVLQTPSSIGTRIRYPERIRRAFDGLQPMKELHVFGETSKPLQPFCTCGECIKPSWQLFDVDDDAADVDDVDDDAADVDDDNAKHPPIHLRLRQHGFN